ncbi:MAG: twitching motility protein PilT [Clostridiales bacterium]|nr:twitching motility protein PilT [Clostridiales bacterium]
MIQIISGEKGRGKTKILIEKANNEAKAAHGNIVYLDKSNKHMYELSNKIRLVNVQDHFISNYSEFLGYIDGIISCDHDLQAVFLDSFLKIAYISNNEILEEVLGKLSKMSDHFKVDFIISLSRNYDQLPESIQKYVTVSL